MNSEQPTPLQASFWLTNQEKSYIMVVCTIFLIGLVARYFHLKNEMPEAYVPAGLEEVEESRE